MNGLLVPLILLGGIAAAAAAGYALARRRMRTRQAELRRQLQAIATGELVALGDAGHELRRVAGNVSGLVANVRSTAIIIGEAARDLQTQSAQLQDRSESLAATV